MMKKWFLILFFIFYISHYMSSLFALGNNKVIVDKFRWQISETAHFQIYHYKESEPILPLVAHHLEKAYAQVTRDFDFEPREKTPFFFYLTHNEFEQTNVVDVDEGTGGVAEAFKNRFLIPYSGSEKELEHVLTHEFTHILTFNILYGSGFWKSLRLLKTPLYPLWLMEGIAEYEGGKNDATTREMYLRDATLNKRLVPLTQLHSFNHLKPHQVVLAYKESESVLHFIAEEYGEEKVPELFFEFLDKYDISLVLMKVGLDLITLDKKWQEYLEDKYEKESSERKDPEFYGQKLTTTPVSGHLYDFNTNPVWSPDGKKIAFFSDRNGETELYLMDKDGRNLKILVGLKDLKKIDLVHYSYTFYLGGKDLSFSADGRYLVFAGEKNQRDYLYLYDLKKDKFKKIRINLNTLSQPSFSPDGKKIVFVGMKGGINNLFLYDLEKKEVRQLNDDPNDERAPTFSPADSAGKWIVFSREENREYNLALLNTETKEIVPLTDMSGDEIMPSFSPDGKKVIFAADPDGVYDLYLVDLETKEIKRLTKIKGGIFTPQFSPDGKELLFAAFSKGEINIYRGKIENFIPPAEEVKSEKIEQVRAEKEGKVGLLAAYPYRFRASTDLFLPAFMFSTYGGFISTYWQISEYLGSHQLNTAFTYSEPGTILEYETTYSYRQWRPQFTFGLLGLGYTSEENVRKEANGYALQVSYPLDRFNRIETGGAIWGIKESDTGERLNYGNISFIRDTLEGKYLEPRFGSLVNLSYFKGGKIFAGDYEFEKYILYYQKVFPCLGFKSRFHSIAFRGLLAGISGPDIYKDLIQGQKIFGDLWPKYLLRGYDDLRGENLSLVTIEFRFPIFADINYHFWYIVPDLFFKYLGGVIFTDIGYSWKEWESLKNLEWKDLKNSVGIGLRLNLFILQTYPLTLGLDWAKSTEGEKWHFYILPTFYLDVAFGIKRGLPRMKSADVRR